MSSPESVVVLRCFFCTAEIADLHAEHCPSCSSPVRDTHTKLGLDPESLTVATDLKCVHCEYNLRTMHIGSKCPECGAPVASSLTFGDLGYANQAWLRRVRMGVRCMLISIVPVPVFFVGFAILLPAIRPGSRTTPMTKLFATSAVDSTLVLMAIGLWFSTAVEPGHRPPFVSRLCRITAQVSALLIVMLATALTAVSFVPNTPIEWIGLAVVCGVMVPVGVVGALNALRMMALRACDLPLHDISVASMVCLGVVSLLVIASILRGGVQFDLPVMAAIAWLGLLVTLIQYRRIGARSSTLRHRDWRDDGE